MKKTLLLKAMFLLCALIVGSGTMWAEDEVTLWTEDFSSYSAGDVPSGGTYFYVCTDGGTTTKVYNETLAGCTAPELLVSKSNGTFTATVPLDNIEGDLTLTFYTNKQQIAVSTTTTGIEGSLNEKAEGQHTLTFTGVTSNMTQIVIEFKGAGSSNVRLDNIVLKGTKASGDNPTPTTFTVTYDGNGNTSGEVPVDANTYDADNNTVTVLGNTGNLTKEHYSFTGWNSKADGTGTGYVANNTFTISANTTLYAQWAANTNTVTLPEEDQYGTYTMSATNPVAYGTEVTLTYTPAEGYEDYQATWSVNGEEIDANKFTMPDEAITVTVSLKKVLAMTIDFESEASAYSDWTFTNITSNYKNSDVEAHGGLKYGSTDGKASGSIQTINKVSPASLTCYVSKQTTNTTASTWYIQVSSDGTTWADAGSTDAKDMNKGDWKKFTADLINYSDVYVRVYYEGSTAVRLIDDLTLELQDSDKSRPELSFSETEVNATMGAQFTPPTLNTATGFNGTVEYASSNEDVAQVMDIETGELLIVGEGTTVITAAFAGNDDFMAGSASYTLTVTDNRIATTITQENIVLDVSKVSTLTKLTPVVKDADGNVIEYTYVEFPPTVSFEFNFDDDPNSIISSIDNNSGEITLSGNMGTATIKAFYNLYNVSNTYKPSNCTFTITVADLNAPGSQNNPYTVTQAIAYIETLGSETSANDVYVSGIVSQVDSYNGNFKSITYWISDDGTTTTQMQVYSGKGLDGADFKADTDLAVGDKVTVKGKVKMYNNTPEFDKNSVLVSRIHVEKPTFSPEAGSYTSIQAVTISTATEGATIYYTTDGTEPTAESTEYTEAITVSTTTTIKAIAVKDGVSSAVAEATYAIDLTPSIVFDGQQNPINETSEAGSTNIHYVASNLTGNISLVICDAEGNATTYDWFSAELNGETNVAVAWQANDDTENARSAYFYLTDGTTSSDIFTFTQAKYVVDYATLPFNWAGGSSADLKELNGVTVNGLGTDYGSTHDPYNVKFDSDGDYIQIKTDGQPGEVTIDVKMVGGSNPSSITVQGSADGETFTDVETLTISGSQNSILNLVTTNAFDATYRYVRLYFNKGTGSNVGVGPITITKYGVVTNIAINDTNFPDEKFREFLLEQTYGTDGKLTEAEIAEITSLDLSNKGIVVLTGISYFTALKDLNVSYNIIPGDNLAEALPTIDGGRILVMDNTSESEGNTLDAAQANAIKEKGWTPVVISAFGSSSGLKGDVNSDGKVDIADVTNVINIINGKD